ncbi:MAG: hypothetical protein U0869_01720 [Chloroflexota bacterium]
MTHVHRQHPVPAHGAGRRSWLVVAALGAATLAVGGTALAAGPSPAASAAPGASPDAVATVVVLSGPTGSRDGVALADGAALPDPATLEPLDTFGRDPRLTIAVLGDDADGFASWTVDAVPADDPGTTPTTLIGGIAEVPVPAFDVPAPPPGDWLVSAVTTGREPATTGTWAWRLVVPDRSLPDAMPAPDALLWAGGATVVTERGSACYVGMCGDVGGLPPDDSLPRLALARPDEPVALTLSDGTDLAAVRAVAVPLGAGTGAGDGMVLLDGPLAAPAHVVLVPPPPGSGTWRLELSLTYSDRRGQADHLARVVVP